MFDPTSLPVPPKAKDFPPGTEFAERADSGLPLAKIPGAGWFRSDSSGNVLPTDFRPGEPDTDLSPAEFDQSLELWLKS